MPLIRMTIDKVQVQGRRRKLGALVDVDNKTARALTQLRMAEVSDPHVYERADLTAEPIAEVVAPKARKRAYKRADLRASK